MQQVVDVPVGALHRRETARVPARERFRAGAKQRDRRTATAYAGEGGRTALRLETECDLRIVQRLVLQPDVKVDLFGRNDARRGIGAGLSEIEAGLRLRYAFSRRVAPYVGVVWNRKSGHTARLARDADGMVQKIEAVAGIHLRF